MSVMWLVAQPPSTARGGVASGVFAQASRAERGAHRQTHTRVSGWVSKRQSQSSRGRGRLVNKQSWGEQTPTGHSDEPPPSLHAYEKLTQNQSNN